MSGPAGPLQWTEPLAVSELAEVARVAAALGAAMEVAVTEHWVCCRVPDGRDLGMWRSTGQWFEADEDGAMGDEPVSVEVVPQPAAGRKLVFGAHVAPPDVDIDAVAAALKPYKAEGMTGGVWATELEGEVAEVASIMVLLDAAQLHGPLADVMRLSPQAQEARAFIEDKAAQS